VVKGIFCWAWLTGRWEWSLVLMVGFWLVGRGLSPSPGHEGARGGGVMWGPRRFDTAVLGLSRDEFLKAVEQVAKLSGRGGLTKG
jgi:hypothetical protein